MELDEIGHLRDFQASKDKALLEQIGEVRSYLMVWDNAQEGSRARHVAFKCICNELDTLEKLIKGEAIS